ncbi:MAG: multicopper oxidase family protein [Solirubrobacteraceae bacterium]
MSNKMNRREIMKLGLFASAALALPVERVARTQVALDNRIAASALPEPFTIPFKTPPVLTPQRQTQGHDYYSITQRQASVEILPGKRTDVWGYNGIMPGPTIVNHQGRRAVVQQVNDLPSVHPTLRYNVWSSTHLHGSASKPQYDGYASDTTEVGRWKDYVYPNIQEARTLWYHDHGAHVTAPNSYMGLAAMYILHDPHELSLPIPHGAYDVPLCLRDAMFEDNGQLLYDDNSESGVYGDVILVNGVPWPNMRVERRKYRFRILNGSISRSYDLSLDSGEPLIVIGTDGGLMPHPMPVAHLRTSMAERYEVVIDFSKYRIGQRVVMRNTSPANNIDYDTTDVVMAFDVVAEASDTSNNEVPYDLNPKMHVMGLSEAQSVRTRRFEFERKNSRWMINGTTWTDVVNSGYKKVLANPGLGDVEIWELANPHGGWFHPVHIHLVDFKILDRNGLPPKDYERGPKDVVYVGENEVVRVIMRFEHEQGRYMMHCHNLVHEDHDMMTQFEVGSGGDDPIEADPCKDLPAGPLFTEPEKKDDSGPGSSGSGPGSSGESGSVGSSPEPSGAAAPSAGPASPARRRRARTRARSLKKPKIAKKPKTAKKPTGEASGKRRRRRRRKSRGKS